MLSPDQQTMFISANIKKNSFGITNNNIVLDILLESLKRSLNKDSSWTELLLILDLIQGLCLIDYHSKYKCAETNVLSYISTFLCKKDEQLLSAAFDSIMAILVDSCRNCRIFESIDGINLVSTVIKKQNVLNEVA
jgi:hypothetical protein